MKARVVTGNNSTWVECTYDPIRLNWDEAIAAALAGLGLRPGQMAVICKPARRTVGRNNNTSRAL